MTHHSSTTQKLAWPTQKQRRSLTTPGISHQLLVCRLFLLANAHSTFYISPDRPLSIVCIDGSKESDRAFLWAMKTLPRNHGLMLVHGVKVHKACTLHEVLRCAHQRRFSQSLLTFVVLAIDIHTQKVQNLREHRQMAERYEMQCQQNGVRFNIFTIAAISSITTFQRACGMVHFHYQWGDELGEDVCSYARYCDLCLSLELALT